MKNLVLKSMFLSKAIYESPQPMWKRVPTRDETGKLLSDFIILIPHLREQSPDFIQTTLNYIATILHQHDSEVKFANFNLPLNLLWVSHRSLPGVGPELVSSIQSHIPQALLVANK